MFRYKVTLSYDGTQFLGWQRQPEGRTVQSEIEKALSQILNTEITIQSSGRTDAQVHAKGQVFHFDSDKELAGEKFRYSLNRVLPKDIHIIEIKNVPTDFHARFGVKAKHYQYLVNVGEASPFFNNYRYELMRKVDIKKVLLASKDFIGRHDFRNFTSKEIDDNGFIREIYKLDISVQDDIVTFDFIGSGFMRYMVRMIVGTLLAIGIGQEEVSFVHERLLATPRQTVRYKAPGQGLYLVSVSYQEEA
ncbi:MAG: tRNA pseudouridine(38-40) synthase TruA [Firmicutes bacterium]|nr:tRNA pseudouridine(38-40) synthase TruA [Bacillota bacterium]